MKTCARACRMYQIIDEQGTVRLCSWAKNSIIGSVLETDFPSLMSGAAASEFRERIARGDFSNCPKDNCPYLANGTMEEVLEDYDEDTPYPEWLYLGYEGVCNYRCTCCTSYRNMERKAGIHYEEQYEKIAERLKDILPYVKRISANGRGELFASRHTLRLLAGWRPLAPKEEIHVALETNGSLFDKEHWAQIDNLGQYHLKVSVTLMSFQEEVYQFLSGCRYPISRVLDNLRFIKSLREQGIINELELATVVQEQNFREMPEMTRRFLEEFGADRVRLRPVMPGGPCDESVQWFMDVRNPHHPYYEEFRRVMEHEIFRHPRVLLWSSQEDSGRGEHPYWKARRDLEEKQRIVRALSRLLADEGLIGRLEALIREKKVRTLGIYGMGAAGKGLLLRLQGGKLSCGLRLYDRKLAGQEWEGYRIREPSPEELEPADALIITPVREAAVIRKELAACKKELFILEELLNGQENGGAGE